MEMYDVVIFPAAQNDFLNFMELIHTLTPEEADQSFNEFMEEVKVLKKAPKSCPFTRDSHLRLRGYRMLTIDDYLLFFVINGSSVEIRRILYSKRQYERLA